MQCDLRSLLLLLVSMFSAMVANAQQPISSVKQLPLGSVVTISGTVTTGDEWGTIRYIQDATAGIGLFSASLIAAKPGDSMQVNGVLSKYRGELQLSPVLSHQVVAASKPVPISTISAFDSTSLGLFNSQRVQLYCPGVHSCKLLFYPGTVPVYDSKGNCIAGIIPDASLLFGRPIREEHAFISGILTSLDGQQRILIETIGPAALDDCANLLPPEISFTDRVVDVHLQSLLPRTTFLQVKGNHYEEYFDLDIPSDELYFGINGLPGGDLYQARVHQVEGQDTFYSKPVHFTAASSGQPFEIYFNRSIDSSFSDGSSPTGVGGTVIEQDLIRRIDSVAYTLEVAMYNTGRDPIIQAINRAVQRGVAVRYIADDETSNNSLAIANFPVLYRNGDGIMHHKFMVGDAADSSRVWVWAGSTNLSSNQLSSDPNHAYVMYDKALALTYQREFEELWGKQPNHSDSRAGETKDDNTSHLFNINSTLIESYFSPSDETECHIIKAIESADHQLLIGLLLLTSDQLIDAIIGKHLDGVDVRIIVEDRESSAYALNRLESEGIPYAIHDPGPIYHHKTAIIDEGFPGSDPTLVSGSHNWTWSADHINDENTLIFHSQSMANIFRQEYEARWAELDPVAADQVDQVSVKVFPNPASNTISVVNPFHTTTMLQLIDVNGVVRFATGIREGTMHMALPADLANGLYAIRMMIGENQLFEKVLVLR